MNIKESIPDVEAELNKALLNAKIVLFLNNEAIKLYDAKLQEYNEKLDHEVYVQGDVMKALNNFKYPMNYVIAQRILANELIHIDSGIDVSRLELVKENELSELDELFS